MNLKGIMLSKINQTENDKYHVSFREDNGTPLQYSCLENPMDRGAWWAAVHGVAEGLTQLNNFTFTFHFHVLEKEMATHSSVLAWRIPGMGEPSGLPSMGSHRVRHDWSDLAAAVCPYFLCGIWKSWTHQNRMLVGRGWECGKWGHIQKVHTPATKWIHSGDLMY